jgi:hypothetical protein
MKEKQKKDWLCYEGDNRIISVKAVEVLDDYKLLLTFSNKERRIYDMTPVIEEYNTLKKLKNKGLFKLAHVEGGTVIWNDELDIAPEELYWNSAPVD